MSPERQEPRNWAGGVILGLFTTGFVLQVLFSFTAFVSEAFARTGAVAQTEGHAESALHFYERAYAWNDRDVDLLYRLGHSRRENGDEQGAAEAFRRSLSLAPNEPPTLVAYAELLASTGDLEGAEEFGARALRLVPYSWTAEHVAGMVCGLRGDHADAANHFQRALDLSGRSDPRILNQLANALYEEGEWSRALRSVDTALVKRPLIPENHLIRGKILLAMGQPDEAAKA